jgi:hypothetical protein
MGDCHVRIDAATGLCAYKTTGSLNCAVEGNTGDFMQPTGRELNKIQCKCGRKSTPTLCKNGQGPRAHDQGLQLLGGLTGEGGGSRPDSGSPDRTP